MAKKKTELRYYEAIGRRKSATCRVRLYLVNKEGEASAGELKMKKGQIFVNKRIIAEVYPGDVNKQKYLMPFKLTNTEDRFATSIHVRGGGKKGQIDAIVLGESRALQMVDATLRPALKKAKLLTRDPRVRESRKVGKGGKARRAKQSPKR